MPVKMGLVMFEEIARLKFYIPKPFVKNGRHTDKYPFVVMESLENGNIIRGKFPDKESAEIFLEVLRSRYIVNFKNQMIEVVEQTIEEQRK